MLMEEYKVALYDMECGEVSVIKTGIKLMLM